MMPIPAHACLAVASSSCLFLQASGALSSGTTGGAVRATRLRPGLIIGFRQASPQWQSLLRSEPPAMMNRNVLLGVLASGQLRLTPRSDCSSPSLDAQTVPHSSLLHWLQTGESPNASFRVSLKPQAVMKECGSRRGARIWSASADRLALILGRLSPVDARSSWPVTARHPIIIGFRKASTPMQALVFESSDASFCVESEPPSCDEKTRSCGGARIWSTSALER